MKPALCWLLLAAILVHRAYGVRPTEPTDEDDDDWDEEEDSAEADDDSRIYKNPRNSPSTECPRDEEQATLLGQKCLRKCSSDEDCKSKKKKCLCDGACGMSCIKPDRECPELNQPALGTMTLSGRHFGERATYTCPHGYHVVGLQSRLCQADGHWAGQEPACKQNIYCLTPPTIEHARHSALPEQATFDLDNTVQYHCHTGYVTAGFPRAKCLAIDGQASWYGPDVQCEPRTCGQPPDPTHGWHAGECYTFGCRVTYHCGDGFELVGKLERFCQADGSWTPKEMPSCVYVHAVQCPEPEDPKTGKAIYTSISYNSVVSYECRYGYTLVGESSRRCGADRKWSGSLPSCKEINCGHPGSLYNGWLENIETGTGLGASIIFRCHPGMMLVGNTSTVCQIDGRWRYPAPECLAPCVVPTISQGTVIPMEIELDPNVTTTFAPDTLSTSNNNQVRHGTTLDVVCVDQYEFPVSSLAVPTCNNGTWSVIPRCIPARCKGLPRPPKFGMVLAPKTEHGMKARFKCKDGFNLTGPGGKEITDMNHYVLTCAFGNWTGETPQCQEVYCSFPGYIPHGKILLVGNMGLYDYRPYVKKIINNKQIMYDCDKGYVLGDGPPGATCVGGLWRPTELPKCLLGQHPRLRWNRRRRSVDMKFARSRYLLANYRHLQRYVDELLNTQPPGANRTRRDLHGYEMYPEPVKRSAHMAHLFNVPHDQTHFNDVSQEHKRFSRTPIAEGAAVQRAEEAYAQYMRNINQRYRQYIRSIFGQSEQRRPMSMAPPITMTPIKSIAIATNGVPTQLLSPLDRFTTAQTGRRIEDTDAASRQLSTNSSYYTSNQFQTNKPYSDKKTVQPSKEDYANALHLQLMRRRKRDTAASAEAEEARLGRKNGRRNVNATAAPADTDGGENGDRQVPGKPKSPCQAIEAKEFMHLEMVREGRDPSVENSAGTIIRATCAKEYTLNLQNPNGTVKCVRGRWKPSLPECTLMPCTVPYTEHGTFVAVADHPDASRHASNTKLLAAYDEIYNGEIIDIQCDAGYNIQGANQLKCWHGLWDVTTLPECTAAPCVLPTIVNAVYNGGYRAGFTISHESTVSVQCDNPSNNLPVQMACTLGKLSPSIIHCGSGARKSREEYLTDVEYANNGGGGGSSGGSVHGFAIGIGQGNEDEERRALLENGRDCGTPTRMEDALVYRNGPDTVPEEDEAGFESGTEITFNCIANMQGERTTWKIICEDGTWVGRSQICANSTCIFHNNEPNVVSFYNDQEIKEEVVEFPPGATIVSRCTDVGKFAMTGSNERTCIYSEWSGNKPVCFGLNQENDYAMEKSPTILFRYQDGPIAQSNDGKLIVYPGTTLHMECLWMRRFGIPKWNVSHEFRTYVEGWVTDENRDATLEYRLTIPSASEDDSGVFTCMTPARHEHSINVLVRAVQCAEIPQSGNGLNASTNDTKMSTRVQLSCVNGNSLIGTAVLVCLPSGNWSAPFPVCETVECGDVPLVASSNRSVPRVAILSREVGGRAAFSCKLGYGIRGKADAICLPTGEWSTPFPTCVEPQPPEVQCENPGAPANGYAQGSAPYRAGDVVQFNCNPEYMMQGQPIIACQDSGRWSSVLPKCVQACSYPGTAIAGRMSSVKFYYPVGENITFDCDPGLMLRGARMLKCLRNGKWSSAIPTCVTPGGGSGGGGSGGAGRGGQAAIVVEPAHVREHDD